MAFKEHKTCAWAKPLTQMPLTGPETDGMGLGAGESCGMGGSQPCNAGKIALPLVFLESLPNCPLFPAVAQLQGWKALVTWEDSCDYSMFSPG